MFRFLATITAFFFVIVLTFRLPVFLHACPSVSKTDSLRIALNKENNDSTRLELFQGLYEYWEHKNTDSAIYYANKALDIALLTADSLKIAEFNSYLGILYMDAGNNKTAMDHLKKSLSVAQRNDFQEIIALSYMNIGNVLKSEENYKQALEHYYHAAGIYKKTGNQTGIANNMNNIAVIYRLKGKLDKAIDYFGKSYDIYKKTDNLTGQAHTYNNIGIVYYQMNKPELALKSFYKVAQIRKDLQQYLDYGNTLYNIAFILYQMGEHEKAKEKCLESLNQAKSVASLPLKRLAYLKLVNIYSSLGEYEKAYNYHEKLVVTADSLFNIDKQKQIIQLKSKYLVDKERYEIDLLEKENELINNRISRLNYYLFSSGTLFMLLVVLSGVIYFNNRSKTKQNKELWKRNKIISGQKDEYVSQRDQIKKHNKQLNRQQKEIIKQKDLLESKAIALEKAVLSLEEKNQQIKSSLRYAGKLQKTMQTDIKLLNKCFKDTFVYRKNTDEVFNSFYWINISDNNCILTFADTHTDSIPGAFIMILINDLLNKIIKNNNQINIENLIYDNENGIYSPEKNNNDLMSGIFEKISLTILKIDLRSGNTVFTGKNLPLIHISDHKTKVINNLTSHKGKVCKENALDLQPNDIIIIPNKNVFDYLTDKGENLKHVFTSSNKSGDLAKMLNPVKDFLDNTAKIKQLKGDLMFIGIKI